MERESEKRTLSEEGKDISTRLGDEDTLSAHTPFIDRVTYVILSIAVILSVLAMINGMHVKSLLLDEAFFARNLQNFPQGYTYQSAPSAPLFYLISYALVSVLGDAEWVLRLFPLITAVAGLLVMLKLVWTYFSRMTAVLTGVLTASSIPLIEYSANAHPYATDFFCSVILLVSALAYLNQPSRRNWWVWIVVAFVSVSLSLPAVFVVVIFIVLILGRDIRERAFQDLRQKMKGLIPLAVFMIALGVFLYLPKAGSRQDMFYWEGSFPESLLPWTVLKWAFTNTTAMLGYFFWSYQGGLIGLFLILLGTAWLLKKKQAVLCAVCWGPVILSAGAALFQKWPYGPIRVMLFTLPFFAVLVASGLELVKNAVRTKTPRLVVLLAFISLLVPQSWILTRGFQHIADSEEAVRSLSAAVQPDATEDDVFIVYYAAEVQFQYYFSSYLDQAVVQPWTQRGQASEIRDFLESHIPEKGNRFWLIFSHVVGDEDAMMVSIAESSSRLIRSYTYSGCGAYLFESER